LVSDNLVEETFLAFVIGGICAGAVFSLSYHLPTFVAYVVPAVLPLSGHFFLDGRLVNSGNGRHAGGLRRGHDFRRLQFQPRVR